MCPGDRDFAHISRVDTRPLAIHLALSVWSGGLSRETLDARREGGFRGLDAGLRLADVLMRVTVVAGDQARVVEVLEVLCGDAGQGAVGVQGSVARAIQARSSRARRAARSPTPWARVSSPACSAGRG